MSFRKQSISSSKKKSVTPRGARTHKDEYQVDTSSNEFVEVCKTVYINELKNLDEEISSSEELLLCKQINQVF